MQMSYEEGNRIRIRSFATRVHRSKQTLKTARRSGVTNALWLPAPVTAVSSSIAPAEPTINRSAYNDLIELNENTPLKQQRTNNPFEDTWQPVQPPPDLIGDTEKSLGGRGFNGDTFTSATHRHWWQQFHNVQGLPPMLSVNLPSLKTKFNQIKLIRWHDGNGLRQTPVLMQNANGPCPLLALVNALTLSTPAEPSTALVSTLAAREQVSLNLLLDAVFEELMSGRRNEGRRDLPNVEELYNFLIALHTGMNVNPNLVPKGLRGALERGSSKMAKFAQYFEQTREIQLYSTFAVPVIHGWLPEKNDMAYGALERTGRSYEECQNLLLREEELEHKKDNATITAGEIETLHDLRSIKEFISHWPTQLTQLGMDTIQSIVQPGDVVIFFRNDHFSTMYKQPKTNQLMTLVTDAGYASHDEIVWESLVDINGALSEMFSGDFRSVSHSAPAEAPVTEGEWTKVGRSGARNRASSPAPPISQTSYKRWGCAAHLDRS